MARRWTPDEERIKRKELIKFYVRDNKTIGEIADVLNIGATAVYDRLIRLGIHPLRSQKLRYNNRRNDIVIPDTHSPRLAEFIGILLGDGSLTPTQVTVTLGKKDKYADYVCDLIHSLFGIAPKIIFDKNDNLTVYFGSTVAVRWLLGMRLVFNKVKEQVNIPRWILSNKDFMRAALRGLFDTDGSVYRLRWGMQISFCNRSRPLIESVRTMLLKLRFHPSRISGYNLYLTRKEDTDRFFKEIGFKNRKHIYRFLEFKNR